MTKKEEYIPIELPDYVPKVVSRLMARIRAEHGRPVVLYGFGDNMKWLFRLLREEGVEPRLCDWRADFVGYDCGGGLLESVDSMRGHTDALLVMSVEHIGVMKAGMRYLLEHGLGDIPVIYDRTEPHSPYHQEEPFKSIAAKAKARARSMIADEQLFDLIQFIRATSNVEGDVVEYGSLHGGSGAILVEAVNHYGKKPVWLFDSFDGIPKSRYGLDHRWNGAFSNNSFREVQRAFEDCDHVRVIRGNICETYDVVAGPISFGYIASDTLESGEVLLDFMWPKLSVGGIIAVCDYGSYPNCVPLTMIVDKFLESQPQAMVFHTAGVGIFIMKR